MRCCNCPTNYTYTSPARNGGGCDIDCSDDFGCDMEMDTENLYYGEPDSNDDDDLPF